MQVEVAEVTELVSLTLVGLQTTLKPEEGVTNMVMSTVPLKLFRLAIVIVDVPDEPGKRLRDDGLVVMVKSREVLAVTVTVTKTECVRLTLVPVTVTV